ncbi:hypothetical protein [Streptomyces sp. NPDC001530]|uniref:hypothetical protein n=1 Tax=Streptomyces sp. NPDC001530 TaxID=3364582 RepID=UPI0036C0A649
MSAPAPTIADEFPIHRVRFVNGRTWHRTRRPDDERWWDLLEAACGKTGYLASGYTLGTITECRGCRRAVERDT